MADKPLVRDSGNSGLIPLFDFANVFVDGVYPETIGDFIEEHGITTFSGFTELDWREYIGLIIGGVICAVVGVLFFVCLPFYGCCFCCCRTCCGCCQPQKKKPYPHQPSSCKKWSCCSILFVLVSGMFAAVVCSYLAISMVDKEFTDDGFMNDLVEGLDGMERYLHDSVDDVDKAIFPPLNDTITEVFLILDQLPETTVTKFAKDTGIDPALYDLESYTDNLDHLNINLTAMDTTTDTLNVMVPDMNSALTPVGALIEGLLLQCVNDIEGLRDECQALSDKVSSLTADARYDGLDDVGDAITATDAALTAGIPAVVSGFVDSFEAIEDTINTTIGKDVGEIKKAVREIQTNIKEAFDEFAGEVKDITVDDITNEIKDVQPDIEYYAAFGIKGLYGISTVFLIAVLLFLIGIPMGAFGSPSSAKHGANCVLAGVAFTFIFGAIFMLLTTVMFLIGSVVQAGGCRHLVVYDDSMQSLEKIIRNEIDSSTPYNLTVRQFLDSCYDNQALYTAFRLDENGYNVSKLLDLDNTELPNYINQLKNITIDIGTITVITDEVNQTMLTIESLTNAIDFDEYLTELEKDVTEIDVQEYSTDLKNIADQIEPYDDDLADDLRTQADELDDIHTTHIEPMYPLRDDLRDATEGSIEITTSVSMSQVMGDLTTAQNILNTEADRMIQEIIGVSADSIFNELERLFDGFIASIENDIAGCKPAYDSFSAVIYGPCVYFLYPYNALWCTYGWYLAFGFIAIFFATSVVGMFRVKALGRKVSSSDAIAMSTLHVSYHPKNVVAPYGNAAGMEPPPDYEIAMNTQRPPSAQSTALSEKLNSSKVQLTS